MVKKVIMSTDSIAVVNPTILDLLKKRDRIYRKGNTKYYITTRDKKLNNYVEKFKE